MTRVASPRRPEPGFAFRGSERPTSPATHESDELLDLSERIFEQDIELLQHAEKLRGIEKLKSDFIEKMSRELRSPLTRIIESIVCVLADENENLSEQGQRALRRALDEGAVYQRNLENILELWRIKQGELPVETQSLNVSEVIEETIFSVQDTLDGKPIEIVTNLQSPMPRIRTDLTKLHQILFLLLENAAKFTVAGRIQVSARIQENRLLCRIQDTGIGICPDDQEHVFDEFFQVDPQGSGPFRGAGLGLTLVRGLLTLLSGECQIESEPGRGTIASIAIPVGAERESAADLLS